jgi:thioredoxin-related protein
MIRKFLLVVCVGLSCAFIPGDTRATIIRRAAVARQGQLLVFSQPNCPPCDRVKDSLTRVSLGGISVRHIDTRADPAAATQYGITATPTLVLLDVYGREVSRRVGYMSPLQLSRWLR